MNNIIDKQENSVIQEKVKKPFKFKGVLKKLKWPLVIAIVAAVGVGAYFAKGMFFQEKKNTTERTAQVQRMDIESTITGSGAVVPISQYNITSLVKGDILEAPFEEGDKVTAGQLLYRIDQTDAMTNIEKSKNDLNRKELADKEIRDNLNDLIVTAPIDGKITGISCNEGDALSGSAKIATVYNDQTMKLTVPFNSADAANIQEGQSAQVTLPSYMSTVNGTVARVSGERQAAGGMIVRDVEIDVPNPGAIKKGDTASATVTTDYGVYACNANGTFDYYDVRVVNAKQAGTVKKLYKKEGDYVKAGDYILTLENQSLYDSARKSSLDLQDARLTLENNSKTLENYNIKSPISGTVISKTAKAGDKIDNVNSQTVLAVVADISKMELDLSVDELDIAKVKPGQKVNITADALPKQKFEGVVDLVTLQGKTSNGVTTYPVKIIINSPGDLKPNMNVNAEIVVESKQNVLAVPISAVRRGNIVIVKKNDSSSAESPSASPSADNRRRRSQNSGTQSAPGGQGSSRATGSGSGSSGSGASQASGLTVPPGYEVRRVETGINNQDNIEIVSGLSEGDTVLLPEIKTATTTNSPQGGFVMPGGPGGYGGGVRTFGGGSSSRTSGGGSGGSQGRSSAGR